MAIEPKTYTGVQSWTSNLPVGQEGAIGDFYNTAKRLRSLIPYEDVILKCQKEYNAQRQRSQEETEDIGCHIAPHWALGTSSFVQEVHFDDGTRWALKTIIPHRFGKPEDQGEDGEYDTVNEAYQELCDERDAMEFLRYTNAYDQPSLF